MYVESLEGRRVCQIRSWISCFVDVVTPSDSNSRKVVAEYQNSVFCLAKCSSLQNSVSFLVKL